MVSTKAQARPSERGGAGVKFLIVFVALVLAANAGYHYVPVAYAGENFKSEMQTSVVNGMATNGRMSPVDYVKDRLQKAIKDNDLPPDTYRRQAGRHDGPGPRRLLEASGDPAVRNLHIHISFRLHGDPGRFLLKE